MINTFAGLRNRKSIKAITPINKILKTSSKFLSWYGYFLVIMMATKYINKFKKTKGVNILAITGETLFIN